MPGRRFASSLLAWWGAFAALVFALPARADDTQRPATNGDPRTGTADGQLQPPELVVFAAAEYPEGEPREHVAVGLRLTLDREGFVTEAVVVEPAGGAFDEAARGAASKFRFRPARRNGVPVAARILYRYEFWPPAEPAVSAEPEHRAASEPDAAAPVAPQVSPAPPPAASTSGGTAVASSSPASSATTVTVYGQSEAERRRQSAEAVTVVEIDRERRQSADMGEVLARTQGVGVRRSGGLGSTTRFSLNGLTDDQVRFFLDGVPLELAGYPFGIANIPVNLVDRVEVYSGVVPVRLGADALGGAVNLVTDRNLDGTHGAASYEMGSFGTHRLSAGARHLDAPSGLFARAQAFFDSADNDYPIDVEVPDDKGQLSPARVRRFHDAYRAAGANVEFGLVERKWAKRFLSRFFVTDYEKEYQHNVVMTVPYGGVTYGETSAGGALRYQQPLARGLLLDVQGGVARTRSTFVDVSSCVYDWYGRCVRQRRKPGETDTRPHDQVYWEQSGFGRLNLAWQPHPQMGLRVSGAPTFVSRTGDERRQSDPTSRDALAAERELFTLVNGAEYELDLLDDRLENIFFFKQYVQRLDSEEPRPGNIFRRRDRSTDRLGVGNASRYRLKDWLYLKASYEFATRLPRPDEVFGDNAFILANLELEPETSKNVNLGGSLDARETSIGAVRAVANGFLRDAEHLIVLLGNDREQKYQNVFGARSLGVEAALGWTAPGEFLSLDVNATYQDFRNTSERGTFGAFAGDRIPNRPFFFANASAQFLLRGVVVPGDELELGWDARYVHWYFRSWESIGLREFKQVIPSQLVHSGSIGYVVHGPRASVSGTLEVQNVTDQPVFDFFGVQRPGRAFFAKTTAEL